MKPYHPLLMIAIFSLLLTTCQSSPTCPPVTGTRQFLILPEAENSTLVPASSTIPIEIEINGIKMMVDKVVTGPLCNDKWRGKVYVACEVQVLKWEESPLFLKNCDLSIEPGTVVYVAYHNNAAYYNGCSCHTEANPER